MEEFAIIHETPTTQILIDSEFNHYTENYSVRIKFWSDSTNAFIQVSPSWNAKDEEGLKRYFKRLKNVEYVKKHCNALLCEVGLEPEFEEVPNA